MEIILLDRAKEDRLVYSVSDGMIYVYVLSMRFRYQ